MMNIFLEWAQSGRHKIKMQRSTNRKQQANGGSVTINSVVENTDGGSARGTNSESPGLKLKVENHTEFLPSMVTSNVGGSIRSRSGR